MSEHFEVPERAAASASSRPAIPQGESASAGSRLIELAGAVSDGVIPLTGRPGTPPLPDSAPSAPSGADGGAQPGGTRVDGGVIPLTGRQRPGRPPQSQTVGLELARDLLTPAAMVLSAAVIAVTLWRPDLWPHMLPVTTAQLVVTAMWFTCRARLAMIRRAARRRTDDRGYTTAFLRAQALLGEDADTGEVEAVSAAVARHERGMSRCEVAAHEARHAVIAHGLGLLIERAVVDRRGGVVTTVSLDAPASTQFAWTRLVSLVGGRDPQACSANACVRDFKLACAFAAMITTGGDAPIGYSGALTVDGLLSAAAACGAELIHRYEHLLLPVMEELLAADGEPVTEGDLRARVDGWSDTAGVRAGAR